MKIRRYTCKDMQEALLKVKMDLGSEAVIINSRKVKRKGLAGLFSKPLIEVLAAIDDDYVRPSRNQASQTPVSGLGQNPYTSPAGQPAGAAYPQAGAYSQVQAHMAYQAQNLYQAMAGAHPSVSTQPSVHQPQHQAQYQPQQMPPHAVQQTSAHQATHSDPFGQRPNVHVQPVQSSVTAHTAGRPGYAVMNQAESPKLIELENKIRNMETMIEQIYRSVRERDVSAKSSSITGVSGYDDLNVIRKALENMELDTRLIDKIIEKVRERGGSSRNPEEAFHIVSRIMTVLLGEPDTIKLRDDGRPQVVIFVGPTGVGKTTTLAKIAADFTLNRQKKVGLITADTYRIAAVEQLKTYSEILNIPVLVVYSPNEVQDAIREFSDKDLILIDTAGRSHRNKAHFDELKALVNSAEADEAYLVVSANTSRYAMEEIVEYYSFMKNYKLLFTKLDETPVPGAIINARYLTGKPLSYTTSGQSVPDDLDVANPRAIVASLLGAGRNK